MHHGRTAASSGTEIWMTNHIGIATSRTIPTAALVLGTAGLLPFVALALAPLWSIEPFGRPPLGILAVYAAVVLSFMGAVHWGLAMAEFGGPRATTWGYIASVIPALVGWFALSFFPLAIALRIIAATYVGLLLYDIRAARLGRAPQWYARLRPPLTVVVATSLIFASSMAR